MMKRTYVGFGFGAIQAGLFLYEAFRSRNFDRLVVAEVVPEVVEAVRRGSGTYRLNVATRTGIETHTVSGLEIFNPHDAGDLAALVDAVAEASELATALPSIDFYGKGEADDVAGILAAGLARKTGSGGVPAVIYTAENHNHAAERLGKILAARMETGPECGFQCLNTVIGKMSGVVVGSDNVQAEGLAPLTEGSDRAFLVEEFNRILVSRVLLEGFERGIEVFDEKPDLLPFEEAKLYGHNATHALIGYLLQLKGAEYMADAAKDSDLMTLVRSAFMEESGAALCRKHAGVDRLFTEGGYAAYVDDLLERMVNPYLHDRVDRITRDPRRKLGWDDRLIGTMRVVLGQCLEPRRYAKGAAAALRLLSQQEHVPEAELLKSIWAQDPVDAGERQRIEALVRDAVPGL